MRFPPRLSTIPVLLAGCGGYALPDPVPATLLLPEQVTVVDVASGTPLAPPQLLARLAGADLVLLGELHDNAVHHQVRGALIRAMAAHRPAVVFEQFAASDGPIPPPSAGQNTEDWLDASGFDRAGWRWPLHRPVVDAAVGYGRAVWGSGVSREALRSVVREGAAGAAPEFQRLMEQAPLEEAARDAMDRILVDGHCGQLPEAMVPGMRAAQEVRDAAMTRALLAAVADGPAWLVAGNGHVRADLGVPRLLRVVAPEKRVLVVGLVEREAEAVRGRYDLVIVTPPAARSDPCAR